MMEFPSDTTLTRVGHSFPTSGYIPQIPPAHQIAVPPFGRDQREPPPFTRRLSRYERTPPSTGPMTTRKGANTEPSSGDIKLKIRQNPKDSCQAQEGKERQRKPVDPPPIVELLVKPEADPGRHFLQSPYLFANIVLYKADSDEPVDANGNNVLIGTLVSSLHRLKDIHNTDAGFFVFADISVKVCGTFRLLISLFDLRIENSEAVFLGSVTSDKFTVIPPKNFHGMDESTYLSRTFSDQGVRIRLRKEPRGGAGSKRRYQNYSDDQQTQAPTVSLGSGKRQKPSRTPDLYQESSRGSFTSPYGSFPTPAQNTLAYTSQQTTPSYAPYDARNMERLTVRPPPLRSYASMDNTAQQFQSPLDPRLSTIADLVGTETVQDLNFHRRPTSMSQAQPPHNMFRPLTQGHENFSMTSSMPTPTSIANYPPSSHWGVIESQQPPTALPIPHSMPSAHHQAPLSRLQVPNTTLLPPVPQSHGPSHQPHDSVLMGTAQFNHSTSQLQSGSLYADNPVPYHIPRFEGQQQMSAEDGSLYSSDGTLAKGQQQINAGEGSLYPNASSMSQGPSEAWTSQGHG